MQHILAHLLVAYQRLFSTVPRRRPGSSVGIEEAVTVGPEEAVSDGPEEGATEMLGCDESPPDSTGVIVGVDSTGAIVGVLLVVGVWLIVGVLIDDEEELFDDFDFLLDLMLGPFVDLIEGALFDLMEDGLYDFGFNSRSFLVVVK